jgi:hypothetical protein
MLGSSWVAAQLAASQEGLSSMSESETLLLTERKTKPKMFHFGPFNDALSSSNYIPSNGRITGSGPGSIPVSTGAGILPFPRFTLPILIPPEARPIPCSSIWSVLLTASLKAAHLSLSLLSHDWVWPETGFGLVIGFIAHLKNSLLQIITTVPLSYALQRLL